MHFVHLGLAGVRGGGGVRCALVHVEQTGVRSVHGGGASARPC
jgi:hypothetical protein